MTNVTVIPDITTRVRVHGNNALSFYAAEAIKAGAAVTIDDDGYAQNCNSGDAKIPIGVADFGVTSSGDEVTVNTIGTVCYVANLDDTTAIGEGTTLVATSVDGVVAALAGGDDSDEYALGVSLTDITGGGFGLCLIRPYLSTTA